MFGPSLKSVPGCLVSIVPMLIGVPVAATPGFLPHDDVLTELVLELVVAPALELVALDPPLAAVLEVLELLLPHAATNNAAPTTAASAIMRRRGPWCSILTSVLLLEMIWLKRPGLARRGSYSGPDLYATAA